MRYKKNAFLYHDLSPASFRWKQKLSASVRLIPLSFKIFFIFPNLEDAQTELTTQIVQYIHYIGQSQSVSSATISSRNKLLLCVHCTEEKLNPRIKWNSTIMERLEKIGRP